ncbi:unnamed protein product [Mycena citricolor]|uniref:Pentatricopeptide repeat-containing protein n=1 Tax=Mycena citricolor TaxID=2018698 RepID=A0AAD2GS00_9AGAR|nr:unnamed protein product [Mycena citricolor]
MVEPVGSIILNSLRTAAFALPASVSGSAAAVARSSGGLMTPGFFNPVPRRAGSGKGKERMVDVDFAGLVRHHDRGDARAAYSEKCQEWSCRMRVSIWCLSELGSRLGSVRNLTCVTDGMENPTEDEYSLAQKSFPRNTRRIRRSGDGPPRRRVGLPPVLHRTLSRHAIRSDRSSSSSDPPPPSSSAYSDLFSPPAEVSASSLQQAPLDDLDSPLDAVADPDPASPPPLDDISETDSPPLPQKMSAAVALSYLRRLIAEPQGRINPRQVWHAYETVGIHDLLRRISSRDVEQLVTKFLVFGEGRLRRDPDIEDVHELGDYALQILKDTPSAKKIDPTTGRYLTARAMALQAKLQDALDVMHTEQPRHKHFGPFLHAYESILVSTWRHRDPVQAAEFLVFEWKAIGSFLITESSREYASDADLATAVTAGASLRKTAFHIVSRVSLPAIVLADKQGDWPEQNVRHLGDLLIESYFRTKHPLEALDVVREMKRQNLKPAVHLPLQLVRVLARANLYVDAHGLYDSIPREHSYEYLFTGLYLHSNEGREADAKLYFDRIGAAGWMNVKAVLQLMYASAVLGKTEKTREIFDEYFPPDDRGVPMNAPLLEHFAVGIFAHAQKGDYGGTVPWLEGLRARGIEPDVYVFTTLLKSFAMRGDLQSVASLMEQMREAGHPPNIVTYTTVMTLMAHRKDPSSVESLYARAVAEGIVPDTQMVSVIVDAHIEAASWKGAIQAFDFILTNNLKPDIAAYNLLLKAYVNIGAPFRIVSRVFQHLERMRVRPDRFTFALLIQSACNAREMQTATKIFAEMERLAAHWGSNRHITAHVMTIIMAGFVRARDRQRALDVYEDMLGRGLEPNPSTYSALVSAYGLDGTRESYKMAEDFLKTLDGGDRSWDLPSYGRRTAHDKLYLPLIRSYGLRGRIEQVEQLWKRFQERGHEPTLSILTAIQTAYARSGRVDMVLKLWPQIFELGVRYLKVPLFEDDSENQRASKLHSFILCDPLSCYVRALSKRRRFDDIADVWNAFKAHGFSYSSDNWNELTLAFIRAGELDRCLEVVEKVMLPYQRRSNRLRSERNVIPDSPLSLDVDPTDQRPLEKPLQAKARESATKWGRYHKRAVDAFSDEHLEDLTYQLHVLHRISPLWNTWRPRHDVLRALFDAVTKLRSGFPVDASTKEVDDLSMDIDERVHRQAMAREKLTSIYELYPSTMDVLKTFERKERERLGRHFRGIHIWA